MILFPVVVTLCSVVRNRITRVSKVGLEVVRTCIVSSFVPWVPLTVIAVIGILVGTRMTDNSELRLLSPVKGIGILTMGSGAIVVSTFGRRVVLLVLVTTIPTF